MTSLVCNDIEKFRTILNEKWSKEEKPSGQIKHTLGKCVINTYDTKKVVIQGDLKYQNNIENIVDAINREAI